MSCLLTKWRTKCLSISIAYIFLSFGVLLSIIFFYQFLFLFLCLSLSIFHSVFIFFISSPDANADDFCNICRVLLFYLSIHRSIFMLLNHKSLWISCQSSNGMNRFFNLLLHFVVNFENCTPKISMWFQPFHLSLSFTLFCSPVSSREDTLFRFLLSNKIYFCFFSCWFLYSRFYCTKKKKKKEENESTTKNFVFFTLHISFRSCE